VKPANVIGLSECTTYEEEEETSEEVVSS